MHELKQNGQELHRSTWKNSLSAISIHQLQDRLDHAEKSGDVPFSDFNDVEMVHWFLQRREHLNQQYDRSSRSTLAYERELIQFIEQLLTYSVEIHLDLEKIVDGSLFKSLSTRHIRRYQEWLSEKSPYVLTKGAYSVATLSRKTTIIKSFSKVPVPSRLYH